MQTNEVKQQQNNKYGLRLVIPAIDIGYTHTIEMNAGICISHFQTLLYLAVHSEAVGIVHLAFIANER